MSLEWMERLAKQQERLEAQRRRIRGQKNRVEHPRLTLEQGSEIRNITEPKKGKGWKVVKPFKTTHPSEASSTLPKSNDALSKKRIAKESRFSGKWAKRSARWNSRMRKFRR